MIFINKKFIFTLLFVILLLGNIFMAFSLVNNAIAAKQEKQTQQQNAKVLQFTDLFIEKVLLSSQEINFETRLTLETMVRDLGDPKILARWKSFTNAIDNQTASIEAKQLLNMLIKKISY